MGFYINQTARGEKLGPLDKARLLLQDEGAEEHDGKEWMPNLVCVVSNGSFQAAAFRYNKAEFRDFNEPRDDRPRVWLTHPKAAELSGITLNKYYKRMPDGQRRTE